MVMKFLIIDMAILSVAPKAKQQSKKCTFEFAPATLTCHAHFFGIFCVNRQTFKNRRFGQEE